MSHAIDTTTGTPALFVAGTAPWHGLGRQVKEAVSSEQAIQLAGLNWQVQQWPVAAITPEGGATPAKGFVANVRCDTQAVLGVVTKKYRPFQNQETFQFADALIAEGNAKYETAGALRGGRRVWMLLKLPKALKAGPDDLIQPFILVYNTFDSSSCLRAVLTSVRVVCQNTLNLALSATRGDGVTIRHRGDLQSRVADARKTLGLIKTRLELLEEEIGVLKAAPVIKGRLDRYFNALIPALPEAASAKKKAYRKQTLDQLNLNFSNGLNTLPGMRGTLWAAFNAVSEWADHERRFRGSSDRARRESRLDSIWFGSSNDVKQAAFRSALDLAASN